MSSYVVDQNGKVTRALHIHIVRLSAVFSHHNLTLLLLFRTLTDALQLNDCLGMLPMDDIAEFDQEKFYQGMAVLNKIAEAIKGDDF